MSSVDRIIPFEDLPHADLYIGAVYLGGSRGNAGDDPLAMLLPVGNQGGFRHAGSPTKRTVRLSVLYTSGVEEEWPDELDAGAGVFTYFGDNRKPGRNLLDTTRGGNRLLRDTFAAARGSKEDRASVPPFLLFEKAGIGRGVRFLGLLAPGAPTGNEDDDLAVVRHRTAGEEFENYRARFSVLGTQVVRRTWLDEILSGASPVNAEAPKEWREWVEYGYRTTATFPNGSRAQTGQRHGSEVSIDEGGLAGSSLYVAAIPPEAQVSEKFEQERLAPILAERREAALQDRYLQFLKSRGHDVCRHRIMPGEGSPLYTDLFDISTGELVEVKSDSGRATVRLALGQILDYARYIKHDSKAVLVPSRPPQDIAELLLANGVAVVWEDSSGDFLRLEPVGALSRDAWPSSVLIRD